MWEDVVNWMKRQRFLKIGIRKLFFQFLVFCMYFVKLRDDLGLWQLLIGILRMKNYGDDMNQYFGDIVFVVEVDFVNEFLKGREWLKYC